MEYNKLKKQETIQKSIRIPVDIYKRIEILAIKEHRDITNQINYMLDKYLEIKGE